MMMMMVVVMMMTLVLMMPCDVGSHDDDGRDVGGHDDGGHDDDGHDVGGHDGDYDGGDDDDEFFRSQQLPRRRAGLRRRARGSGTLEAVTRPRQMPTTTSQGRRGGGEEGCSVPGRFLRAAPVTCRLESSTSRRPRCSALRPTRWPSPRSTPCNNMRSNMVAST